MERIHKYPRTRHVDGSGLQQDDDPDTVPWSALAGRHLVVEEKIDGANCGISFGQDGQLLLQSRGHFLTGGPRERQFDLLKTWARAHAADLQRLLADRYVLYGEWCFAKHSIFYTDLPHYLLEYDLFDTQTGLFLSTDRRRSMLAEAPFIASAPVLYEGLLPSLTALQHLVAPSCFIAPQHAGLLRAAAVAAGVDPVRTQAETDPSGLMEGLYIKVEQDGAVVERYKYVRRGFLQTVLDSGSHWQDRPLVPNRLHDGVSLW